MVTEGRAFCGRPLDVRREWGEARAATRVWGPLRPSYQ